MPIYRRGPLYLVYHSADSGWVYDSATGDATGEVVPWLYLGDAAREWLPVLESEDVPEGLRARLVLRFPGREG